jgi:hypothetical protein
MASVHPDITVRREVACNREGESSWEVLHRGAVVGQVLSEKRNTDPRSGRACAWRLYWIAKCTVKGRAGWVAYDALSGYGARPMSPDAMRCETRREATALLVAHAIA